MRQGHRAPASGKVFSKRSMARPSADADLLLHRATEQVDERMVLERYSHVMHLTSQVSGELADGKTPIDVLRATLPAGTVSGAPKVRAMEIIDELEKEKRGLYAGCVGYFSAAGEMDTCIVLRTALIKDGTIDGVVTISAGDADSAAIGIQQADKVKTVSLGSFDMNEAGLNRIKDGTQSFAIDQQPYLQGYLSVGLLASAIDFGTSLPTFPVLTGPGIVDASNIDATLVGVQKGAR